MIKSGYNEPPEVRERSAQKPSTQIIYIVLHSFGRLWYIFSKKGHIQYILKKKTKTNVELRIKHLKVLVKWNWWWNFTCVCTISLNFQFIFSLSHAENCFRCHFRRLLMSLALRKMIKDCKILKIILVLIFVHQKLNLLDFLSDFVLDLKLLTKNLTSFFMSLISCSLMMPLILGEFA